MILIYYTENNLELPSKEIAKICGKNWKNMKSNEKYEKKQIHT